MISDLDRLKASFFALLRAADPARTFLGTFDYVVAAQNGTTIDCAPADPTIGLPSLTKVPIRRATGGGRATLAKGSSVGILFLDGKPSKPRIVFADDASDPDGMQLVAGGMAATEHAISAEAVAVLLHNTLSALCLANPGILIGAPLQLFILPAINAALAAAGIPAPPTLAAQIATAAAQSAAAIAGSPISSSLPYAAGLAIVDTKTPDVSGLFPSVGSPSVKVG